MNEPTPTTDDPQADAAPFAGFAPPRQNWTKIPNSLIAQLPRFSTKAELAVVLYVLRHTWGFRQRWRRITLEEFENGRQRTDGSRMDGGVGMGREAIVKGLRRAVGDGFLQVHRDDSDGGRIQKHYALRMRGPSGP